MSETATNDRLERLLSSELGECCEGDVRQRRAELDELESNTPLGRVSADAAVLSTLGDETRHRIARLLVAADELCVCELEPLVDVSESAISHALSDLVDAGLADRRKEGKWRYYRATDRTEALLAALDSTEGER